MAIPSSRYVDIVSSVGGAATVSARELVLRVFTPNSVNHGEVWEFTSADNVGLTFGFSSPEYAIAVKYFGFVSKQGRKPKKIQFALWSLSQTAPSVEGGSAGNLAAIQAITNVDITASLNGLELTVGALDLSTSTDLDDAAAKIQVALRAADAGASAWTCTYSSGTNSFTIADPTLPTEFNATTFECDDPTAAPALGFEDDDLTLNNATIVQTPVEAISSNSELNNNFGSFMFIVSDGGELSKAQILTLAEWTHGQNVMYQYHFQSSEFDTSFYNDINTYSGVGVTYQVGTTDNEYHEVLPCAVLAATDFDSAGASQNYMYQQLAGLTPTVKTSALADSLDAIRANYYGQTQESGTEFSFYQRGYLMGLSNAPQQMGVFAGEQWMKAYIKASFLNQLIALPTFPASDAGIALALATISDAVTVAKGNGVISATKELTLTQQQFITAITNNTEAWKKVQSVGYWYDAEIDNQVVNDVTEYYLDYTLIYSKNDSVNKVTGRHILI